MIKFPARLLIGKNTNKEMKNFVAGISSGKIIVAADKTTIEIAGKKVADLLSGETFVIEESSIKEVERLEKENMDVIVCVGGGKVIDVGKLTAFRKDIPFIVFPTALSHDGVVSSRASITVNGRSESMEAKSPDGIIFDLNVIKSCPHKLIAAGAADIISNYSALFDWKLGEKQGEDYNESAAGLSDLAFRIVSDNAELIGKSDEKGLENLLWSLIFSGMSMNIAKTSRPASGAEHQFSHAIDGICREKGLRSALHGEQCGVGCILMSYIQERDWEKVIDLLKKAGAPTTAKELGVGKDIIINALVKAKDIRDRYTILNEKLIDSETARDVCKKTGVF